MTGIIGGAGSRSGIVGETELEYETGTWTIALHPSGVGATITMGTNDTGFYTRIGNICQVQGLAYVDSVSSLSGTLKMNALPFIVATGAPEYPEYAVPTIRWDSISGTISDPSGYTNPDDDTIWIGYGSGTNVTTYVQATTYFNITMTYRIKD